MADAPEPELTSAPESADPGELVDLRDLRVADLMTDDSVIAHALRRLRAQADRRHEVFAAFESAIWP